jgi:SMC interacting uncharacterized protein involved in chromosome segregation
LNSQKTLPLSKIPDYVKEKTTEKGKLEEEIERLKAEIETLREQKEDAQLIRDNALEDVRITIFRLNWYTSIKELGKYGISIEGIPKLAKLVNCLEYDVDKVIKEFSSLENLRLRCDFQNIIPYFENRKEELKRECSELQTWIAVHNQLLSKYHDLENMGFGLNKLVFLWTTVREIARENNLPLDLYTV